MLGEVLGRVRVRESRSRGGRRGEEGREDFCLPKPAGIIITTRGLEEKNTTSNNLTWLP